MGMARSWKEKEVKNSGTVYIRRLGPAQKLSETLDFQGKTTVARAAAFVLETNQNSPVRALWDPSRDPRAWRRFPNLCDEETGDELLGKGVGTSPRRDKF